MRASARSVLRASGSERWRSAVGVALIHIALGAALLSGLGVTRSRRAESVIRLVEVALDPLPPSPEITPSPAPQSHGDAAPRAPFRAPLGGSPGPVKRAALSAPTPPLTVNPFAAGGGSSGTGQSLGSGSGGGTGGDGNGTGEGEGDGAGDGDGGRDLEQIAGEIRRSDYPRAAREARIGGRVEFRFTVGPDGRVRACAITRSSGSAELDETTCRLVTKRFRYRSATDARGNPIAEEVEGEHIWQAWRE
jgi:protein TonB